MAGGAGQPWATMLIERVVVLLLESLRGVWGSGAKGIRQLPVVDGAAVPRDSGLRWEGVAGLRQLPLKPEGRGTGCYRGVARSALPARRRLPPQTGTPRRLSALSPGCSQGGLGGVVSHL